jgi:hypothetical protein
MLKASELSPTRIVLEKEMLSYFMKPGIVQVADFSHFRNEAILCIIEPRMV